MWLSFLTSFIFVVQSSFRQHNLENIPLKYFKNLSLLSVLTVLIQAFIFSMDYCKRHLTSFTANNFAPIHCLSHCYSQILLFIKPYCLLPGWLVEPPHLSFSVPVLICSNQPTLYCNLFKSFIWSLYKSQTPLLGINALLWPIINIIF